MEISFDPDKDARNIEDRNLPFSLVTELDWDTAKIVEDVRADYPERRFVAAAYLDLRLHIVCYAHTKTGIRVISFRKANDREVKAYE